ncbi:hypothetical protein [Brevundimonas sp. R86498]|uniref:hypothetical protein n=1 Tax=Brevundimonas sp. R86498 TaxID=3093845 RepID=UPI0037CC7F2C
MSELQPPAADRPAHYRLGDETWALILKEYREGATAPFLAGKWRVSEHALRRRITRSGSTKRAWGDAQAIQQASAREAELDEARRNTPEAVAGRLFRGLDLDEDEGDPGVLGRTAVLVSGRAMRGRLWNEARHLAGLAETYSRLHERAEATRRAEGITVETIDLQLLYDILWGDAAPIRARFALWGDGPDSPDYALKRAFRDKMREADPGRAHLDDLITAMEAHIARFEREAGAGAEDRAQEGPLP